MDFNLSQRGARNASQGSPWDAVEKLMSNLWAPDKPNGLVWLGVAENHLLHDKLTARINRNPPISTNPTHLTYSLGPRSSPRLSTALSTFFNTTFSSNVPVTPKQILILPGVAGVLDALTWALCNEGEGIVTPAPFYTGFKPLSGTRAGGVLVAAEFGGEGSGLDRVFDGEWNWRALEGAVRKAEGEGVRVRAVLISNPQNPLGRCYPVETLREIARFCASKDLHLISDEIFALSVYDNDQAPDVTPFVSVLSAGLCEYIDSRMVHVMYGMSKDFCATGLRLGVLQSANEGVIAAVSSISVFGWVPYVVQDMWADILEDDEFLEDFKLENRKALTKHFNILRSFLDQNEIPYYKNVHAGVFVWVDLRRYLPKNVAREPAASAVDVNVDAEAKLFKRLLGAGVVISQGSSFGTEEQGWYRISFAVEEETLNVGLQRLGACLKAIEKEGWDK